MKVDSDSKNNTIIKMEHIVKTFGGVHALNDVSLELREGEVLALVGDNAAGKSTIVKILAGVYDVDQGEIYFKEECVQIKETNDARKLGIETIYQNLALLDNLDIPSNIFVGREILKKGLRLLGVLDHQAMNQKSKSLLNNFDTKIEDVNEKVRNLSGGQRQMVALSRSVEFKAQVVIMDEPTAALGVRESKKVYEFIHKLKEVKISVIIVSHNINEVYEIADRFIVLKTGKLVGVVRKDESKIDDIITMIVSGEVPDRLKGIQ